MEKQDLSVGQKVWLIPYVGHGFGKEPAQVTISKIATKFFYIEERQNARFYIKTGMHDGGQYSARGYIVVDIQQYHDKRDKEKHIDFIKKSNLSNLHLKHLRSFVELIKQHDVTPR